MPPLEIVDDILTVFKCSLASVTINAVVNSFIESKKPTLSKKKCSVIHVGKGGMNCHSLKVHGENMHQATSNKYLGDLIHISGKIKENLNERCVKAVASFSVIRAILEDIPLGRHRIEIGL